MIKNGTSFSMLKFLGELIFLIALGWLIGYVPRVDDFYKNDNDEIAMCAKVHTNRKVPMAIPSVGVAD
jgi:hypothetical protein